jgi:hypothetical protein
MTSATRRSFYPTRIRSRAIGFTYAWSRFSTIFVGFMVAFFPRNCVTTVRSASSPIDAARQHRRSDDSHDRTLTRISDSLTSLRSRFTTTARNQMLVRIERADANGGWGQDLA